MFCEINNDPNAPDGVFSNPAYDYLNPGGVGYLPPYELNDNMTYATAPLAGTGTLYSAAQLVSGYSTPIRHFDGSNYLFLDGHVKWLKGAAVSPGYAAPAQQRPRTTRSRVPPELKRLTSPPLSARSNLDRNAVTRRI